MYDQPISNPKSIGSEYGLLNNFGGVSFEENKFGFKYN